MNWITRAFIKAVEDLKQRPKGRTGAYIITDEDIRRMEQTAKSLNGS